MRTIDKALIVAHRFPILTAGQADLTDIPKSLHRHSRYLDWHFIRV
jgi:hypothetical protein